MLFVSDTENCGDIGTQQGNICKICDRKFMIYRTYQKFRTTMTALQQEIDMNESLADEEAEQYSAARKQYLI